jgi:hypothetical protein
MAVIVGQYVEEVPQSALSVMPVITGIQALQGFLDPGFRRGDDGEGFFITHYG